MSELSPEQLQQVHEYDVLALRWASEKIDRLRAEVWSLRALIDESGDPQTRLAANKIRRAAP
jgi:hypothetical protein